ncbi:MAG: homoserine kinase [Gemmatimonadaceae bacterium]
MTALVRVRAFAPASIGNVGPGLDVLGAAVTGAGDSVVAEWCDGDGVIISDPGHAELPREAERHSSGIAALAVIHAARSLGTSIDGRGIALRVIKGLPLSAGQGGSASSAVAGAVAVNALLGDPLDERALLAAALLAEEKVAGRHLDNIAPSLMGGFVLVRSLDPIDVLRLPVPDNLYVVLAHPDQRLRTADARAVLPEQVSRAIALHQMAHVAMMVAALYEGDVRRFGNAIDDRIAEPARAQLLHGFVEAKNAALAAGALGASISGAGPSSFAICDDEQTSKSVAVAIERAYASCGVRAAVRVARIDLEGTRVERTPTEER